MAEASEDDAGPGVQELGQEFLLSSHPRASVSSSAPQRGSESELCKKFSRY